MIRFSNHKVLELLKENSRMPSVKIAAQLGVSEAAVRKAIKKLKSTGVIRRFTIEVDHKKIGLNIDAIVGIDAKPESYLQILERLKEYECIENLFSSTGDHMIMARCLFEDTRKLSEFLKVLEKIDGVIKVCPAIILERIK